MACGIYIPNTCHDIDIITCKIEQLNSTNDGIMNNVPGLARAILMGKVTDIKIHGNFLGKMPSESADVIQLNVNAEDYDINLSIEITNNCIYDFVRRGLKIAGSGVLMQHNYFSDSDSSRNAIEVFGNNCDILNNTIVIQSTWSAVEINGNNNEVKNNDIWIYGNSYTGDDGFGVLSWTRAIYINGGNENLIDNNVIQKSYFGIYLYNADNNTITNNDIIAKDSWIYRRGGSSNNAVSGNTRSNINF
jgi:parallel beta-helix repeat protein